MTPSSFFLNDLQVDGQSEGVVHRGDCDPGSERLTDTDGYPALVGPLVPGGGPLAGGWPRAGHDPALAGHQLAAN